MNERHPKFIYRGGGMMERPPFHQQKTRFYGFFAKGAVSKMQATVDRELNAVGPSAVSVSCISVQRFGGR